MLGSMACRFCVASIVTVTGAFELPVAAPLFELVFAAGLLLVAGLFADVFDEFTVTLPEQAIVRAAKANPRANDVIFICLESSIRSVTSAEFQNQLREYARVQSACQLLFVEGLAWLNTS